MNLPWKVWVLIQRDQFLRDRRPQKVKRSLSFAVVIVVRVVLVVVVVVC